MELVTLAAQLGLNQLGSALMVALGLGFVIFFHELGHFAVAKWCGVLVERFSIGFGPVLWSRKWGETEYALSAIPFGGYVKMLGQDDLDPGQEASTEVCENPRSYTAKSVPQKMAIISAGVAMNLLTGCLFFVGAMRLGIEVQGNAIGYVRPGMPAWEAGVEPDDVALAINGRRVHDFIDITRGTALSTGPIEFQGEHPDGQKYTVEIVPDSSGTKRMIGVGPQESLQLFAVPPGASIPITVPGSPAALAAGGFRSGDTIVAVGGEPVKSFVDLRRILTARRAEPLTFEVSRRVESTDPKRVEPAAVTVAPEFYRSLGIRMDVGEVVGVQRDSPAAGAGIQRKDRIIRVQVAPAAEADAEPPKPLEVGRDLDPARLPDWFADHAGESVIVTLEREGQGREMRDVTLTPLDRRNWVTGSDPATPLAIPAIGAAFQFVPRVLAVEPNSPADQQGIKVNDLVTQALFVPPADWPLPVGANKPITVAEKGWAGVLTLLQVYPTWSVSLTFKPGGREPARTVELKSEEVRDWPVASDRGLRLMPALVSRKADNLAQALGMGWDSTRDSVADIYLTLRGLFSGNISPSELQGPLKIFDIGIQVASTGFAELLLFLGFLSVNLAVINFLPIPVLDGGHMVFLIYEGVTGRRPNERIFVTAMYLGLMFVLGLMLWVLYLDVVRIWMGV